MYQSFARVWTPFLSKNARAVSALASRKDFTASWTDSIHLEGLKLGLDHSGHARSASLIRPSLYRFRSRALMPT